MDINALRGRLAAVGQDHVLRHVERLDAGGRDAFGAQLGALDLPLLGKLADEYVRRKPEIHLPRDIKPVPTYPRVPRDDKQRQLYREAETRGRELLRAG